MSYERSTLGRRLKRLMDLRGMTQVQLAGACDIDNATVSAYVNGSMTPGIDKVWRMSEALGVTPNVLCGWSELPGAIFAEPAGAPQGMGPGALTA